VVEPFARKLQAFDCHLEDDALDMKRYPSLNSVLADDDFEIRIGISEFSVEQTLNLVNLTPLSSTTTPYAIIC
jgi:hypothetical protein